VPHEGTLSAANTTALFWAALDCLGSACHKRFINVNLRHSYAALQKSTRISTHIG